MGNKLSCSCAPLIRKAYRYEDSPWQTTAKGGIGGSGGRRVDTGHLLRLWAEVFHVSASGAGTVKWQQVSEDLVPVNITCIQDSPECVFHITAYNSQVDKILDVRLVQPGTRIGQASECFVYWKDTMTNDTWGLNFTSPIDAKQFRECCSPSFKISRKASSSYSLKLEPPNRQKIKTRRKPLSTPASPNRSKEPQCTCMTPEQFARLRNQEARFRSFCATSTLPRTMARSTEMDMTPCREKITAATSSASLYDNVNNTSATPGKTAKAGVDSAKQKDKQNETSQTTPKTANVGIETVTVGSQIDSPEEKGTLVSPKKMAKQNQDTGTQQNGTEMLKSEGTQAGGTLQNKSLRKEQLHHTKSADYTDLEIQNGNIFNIVNNNHGSKKPKSKSTDDMRIENAQNGGISLDSNTLKRMLKPISSIDSPATSPEMTRKRHSHHSYYHPSNNNQKYVMQETENENYAHPYRAPYSNKFQASRSAHDMGRQYTGSRSRAYLDSERNRCTGDMSPPSDNVIFDNQCYATTPSSSNGNSDMEQPTHCNSRRCNGDQTYQQQSMQSVSTPGSPTSRLLLEYEMHLRNTLEKGMDAESYSLRTFEALFTQSMENLELAENMPLNVQRTPHVSRRRPSSNNKSSTLPLSYRYCTERQNSKDRDGYYSDRNEMVREKRERDVDRDRGYLSDYNSRCASCIGESARAQWFRHSDGWQSGSSTLGSGASSSINPSYSHKRESPWDSLPSLRHEGSLNDSGYKSNRADSLEQRGTFDRQDSVRSDYMSDREGRYGIVQQASLESTDSRICYLTSSEMSDDDRMSLTTAVSDDDDGESVINSPYRGKQPGTAAASFNCTGAVRKAGFLSVKKWLLRKKHQIELARKRGWKDYWVCLKGTTLLFYPCESQESRTMEAAPKHLIIVDGAIMQPIPEHPKRDYIFCLSTAFGDAYLFQAPCQVELENWVNSIHSACAAAFARHRGKTGTLHLLQEEICRLEKAIESDHKLKHMADLQQSVVSDVETKQQINGQIVQWEENLERLHCEQFRLRCYMASLQSGELPNPKWGFVECPKDGAKSPKWGICRRSKNILLTYVSRATKQTLNKLGVFTVSSFHAFICARSRSLLNNLLSGRGATKRRPPLLSRSNSVSSRRSLQISSRDDEKSVKVCVPENQLVSVILRDAMTVEEFLASACNRKNLNPMEHFVRVKKRRDMEDHNYFVPHRTDAIDTYLHTHEIVEVCAKILYQVELQRTTLEQMWGFSVEAELIENSDRQDELCCYVSRVEDKSVAMQNGIIKGDEIMVINGAIVSDLDMMYLESVLQEEVGLCMMMRSSRTEPPDLTGIMRVTDDIIESLVCPPPPSDPPVISDEMISGLIVPAPGWSKESIAQECTSTLHADNGKQASSRTNSFEIENLLKTAEQVTGICRSPGETRKSSPTGSVVSSHSQAMTPSRQLSDAEKLKKVILELIETERTYVKNLNNLLENYLEPLKRETFLSNAEINALFGNIQEIVTFQRQFLQNLDHAIEMEADFNNFDHPSQFKGVLFSIGSAFLYYVNHFKLYSSFCASHSKAQKVLHPNEGNQALQEFLQARNPRQQHSSTLESYLIKPIQRILKYPLLLQQLRNLTDERSDEHQHLIEALKGMEKVAEHINEMQRIHEEYGAIFDHLFRQHQKSCKQPIDLSPGDLLYYGGVEWLNISDFLGKIKKGLELHAMCFVFKSAVVFLCKERLRQKKKLMGVSTKANSSEVEIIRYQVLIPVTEVQVRASSAKDMESHFLWELIHLRSQLQRRSEKVYVLSNSTTEFRNAFLRTIRQIIRESVRNMSIPSTKQNLSQSPMTISPRMSTGHVEKFEKQSVCQGQNGNSNNNNINNINNNNNGAVHQTVATPLTKKASKPQPLSTTHNVKRRYCSSKQAMEHESSEDRETEESGPVTQQIFRFRSKTISDTSGEVKVEMDSGTKSEGEEDSQAFLGEKQANLGRTPNHLTLSTTSTISAGSTGSQARLIQSSHQPENYQPITVKELGSPIWKPRELPSLGEATTLPRKGKSASEFGDMSSSHSASRKSLIEINNCAQQSNYNNHV
ncbi:guanine nucleotide exchange factor still life isoform X2 [Halictus rubicundus]|uniref:guanine nucleotide exchange factor still life isoform X2 n=1 Tax=Halictus rubicundus TaxID=77578 RepID=UPI004036DB21